MLNIFCNFEKWVVLRITNICNHNCVFCTQKEYIKNKNYIKKNHFCKSSICLVINIIKENWYDFVLISWWEPTLSNDLFEIIKLIEEKWIKVILMTNGSNLHNIDIYSFTKKTLFYISYHWFQDSYELIINKNENTEIKQLSLSEFEIVSRNIELLIKSNFIVILKIVINKYNISSLELFVEYILFRFWKSILIELTLMEWLVNKEIRDMACDINDYYFYIVKLLNLYPDNILIEWYKLCDKKYSLLNFNNIKLSISNKIKWEIKINNKWKIEHQKKDWFWKWNIKNILSKCKECQISDICHWYDIFYIKK